MINTITSLSETLRIVVSLVKSPGDSTVQIGLRTTGLIKTIEPTKKNMHKEFTELFETNYICFKATSMLFCFPKEGIKVLHRIYSCRTDPQQSLDPVRKHTVCGY